MRFEFIQTHRERWPISLMCKVLRVSRSGFYAWRARPESQQVRRRHELLSVIREVHAESRRVYGSPRVHGELVARGYRCSVNFVARIMREARIAAKTKRKFKVTTDSNHRLPVAENVLDRQFTQSVPNQVWVADITYISTREGWLYLATVMDLFSRRIVGWSMSERVTSRLAVDALEMAVERRRPKPGLLFHSDRGSQYASDHFQRVLKKYRFRSSMSRRGDCWDNAVMESFYRSLKTELVYWEDYASREEARRSLFQYIEVFYNRLRRHSSLGYHSPAQFETAA